MGAEEKQYQLQRMSKGDKKTLETIDMKLYDDQGNLRLWDDIVDDFMRDVWLVLSSDQRIDAMLILTLIKKNLEKGFTWDWSEK